MHRSLNNLPQRVVIDTNVLLNAAFVANSSARYCLEHLAGLGFNLIIDAAIENEAKLILRRLKLKLTLGYDPAVVFDNFLRFVRIIILPKATIMPSRHVNKADLHVYSVAAHYQGWILTGDLKFAAECQSIPLPVRLPWDVMMEVAQRANKVPPMEYLFHSAGVSRTSGSLFARVLPGSWANQSFPKIFTVCDVENAAKLAYDNGRREWVFSTKFGTEVRLKCEITMEQEWIVCASYDMDGRTNTGKLNLRACDTAGANVQSETQLSGALPSAVPGNIAIGASAGGTDHWNGYLRRIVVYPNAMRKENWKAIRKLPDSAPDPAAGNVLEAALSRATRRDNRIFFPSESELKRAWY
ncbi:MAG: type II toxin-antitoxin system VapC family toxin [Burkholderiaceae bacterium]|nr:type II toxin-antitoxin system VapC family toxin [Burkholderiaceae bacterium]